MIRSLDRYRYLLAGLTLMMGDTAFGQGKDQAPLWTPRPLFSGESALPDRLVRSDLVVLGRVVAVEPKDVPAVLAPATPYTLDYRIAVMKVHEVIHGPKDVNDLRLGFLASDQDRKIDRLGKAIAPLSPHYFVSIKVGQEGLFFLKKHHQGDWYVNPMLIGGFLPRSDDPQFIKNLATARALGQILQRPRESLQTENASNRYLAAVMLITRYRLNGAAASKLPQKDIDAEESKLLLQTLAEADWHDVNEALTTIRYPPHAYRVFLQLGVTRTDGFDPPKNAPDFRDTLAYTQRWLQDHLEKYRIQRVIAASK